MAIFISTYCNTWQVKCFSGLCLSIPNKDCTRRLASLTGGGGGGGWGLTLADRDKKEQKQY